MNQCLNIVNWTLRNKLQWNFNRNSNIFIEENAFESVIREMGAILSRLQCVLLCGWACNQPMRDGVTLQCCLSLAGCIQNDSCNVSLAKTPVEGHKCMITSCPFMSIQLLIHAIISTHWPLGDLDGILKMHFSVLLHWLISSNLLMIMSSDECHRTLLINDKSTLVQVMAWCRQATSHYLNQCWPRSPTPYGVTRPQWVNPC